MLIRNGDRSAVATAPIDSEVESRLRPSLERPSGGFAQATSSETRYRTRARRFIRTPLRGGCHPRLSWARGPGRNAPCCKSRTNDARLSQPSLLQAPSPSANPLACRPVLRRRVAKEGQCQDGDGVSSAASDADLNGRPRRARSRDLVTPTPSSPSVSCRACPFVQGDFIVTGLTVCFGVTGVKNVISAQSIASTCCQARAATP